MTSGWETTRQHVYVSPRVENDDETVDAGLVRTAALTLDRWNFRWHSLGLDPERPGSGSAGFCSTLCRLRHPRGSLQPTRGEFLSVPVVASVMCNGPLHQTRATPAGNFS